MSLLSGFHRQDFRAGLFFCIVVGLVSATAVSASALSRHPVVEGRAGRHLLQFSAPGTLNSGSGGQTTLGASPPPDADTPNRPSIFSNSNNAGGSNSPLFSTPSSNSLPETSQGGLSSGGSLGRVGSTATQIPPPPYIGYSPPPQEGPLSLFGQQMRQRNSSRNSTAHSPRQQSAFGDLFGLDQGRDEGLPPLSEDSSAFGPTSTSSGSDSASQTQLFRGFAPGIPSPPPVLLPELGASLNTGDLNSTSAEPQRQPANVPGNVSTGGNLNNAFALPPNQLPASTNISSTGNLSSFAEPPISSRSASPESAVALLGLQPITQPPAEAQGEANPGLSPLGSLAGSRISIGVPQTSPPLASVAENAPPPSALSGRLPSTAYRSPAASPSQASGDLAMMPAEVPQAAADAPELRGQPMTSTFGRAAAPIQAPAEAIEEDLPAFSPAARDAPPPAVQSARQPTASSIQANSPAAQSPQTRIAIPVEVPAATRQAPQPAAQTAQQPVADSRIQAAVPSQSPEQMGYFAEQIPAVAPLAEVPSTSEEFYAQQPTAQAMIHPVVVDYSQAITPSQRYGRARAPISSLASFQPSSAPEALPLPPTARVPGSSESPEASKRFASAPATFGQPMSALAPRNFLQSPRSNSLFWAPLLAPRRSVPLLTPQTAPGQGPGPGPGAASPDGAPAPNGAALTPAPSPEGESLAEAPVPTPEDSSATPTPSPEGGTPGPSPADNAPGPAPLQSAAENTPGPAPLQSAAVPGPVPSGSAPVPVPGLAATAPTPQAQAPAPGSLLLAPSQAPVPSPGDAPRSSLQQAPRTAPNPAPGSLSLLGQAPTPAPGLAPGPLGAAGLGAAPTPGGPGSAPRPSPSQAPTPALGRGFPIPSPNQAPAPSLAAAAPTPANSQAPTPGFGGGGLAPAPLPGGILPPSVAPGVGAGAPTPLGAGGVTGLGIPASAPGLGPNSQGFGASQAPQPLAGGLGPIGGVNGLSPSASPPTALSQIFPASNLPPAAPGQTATLVTVPQNSGSTGITVRSPSGVVVPATPQDVTTDATLFARPGSLSLIVQSSSELPQLPASAVGVQGGTVTSTSPVQGGNGRLFNVNINTLAGASFLAVSTVAGVNLANGLTSSQSNTVRINLENTPPMPKITSGVRYNTGQTVNPGFTIDFGKQVIETNPQRLYTITNVSRTDVLYDYGNGRIFIDAYILPEQQNETLTIQINVPAGVTTDLAGNPNTGASYTYQYIPQSPSYTRVSTATNAIAGASMAAAVAAPIAVGVGTAASAAPAAGATAAAGTFTLLHILSSLQVTYLAGQMNVANLPPNFKQVADSFSYTVLNFRMPWENARANSVTEQQQTTGFPSTPVGISVSGQFGPSGASQYFDPGSTSSTNGRRRLLQTSAEGPALGPIGASNGTITVPSITGGSNQYVVTSTGLNQTESTSPVDVGGLGDEVQSIALGDGENPYETLWRALFWMGIGLVIITVAVWLIVAFLLFLRWEVPAILQEPRPQFMLLLFAVPAIAQASATLFGGNGKDIAIGVVVVVVFPALMVLFGIFFVWRNILTRQRRRAAWVLEEDPELVEREKKTWYSKLLDVVVGPRGAAGSWVALKTRDSKFVNQYGPLFEVNRGPPMVLTDVTYEVDPKTGYCNRGRLQQIYEKPLLKIGRLKIYPHYLQGHNSSVELAHMIATAILLQAFTQPNSYPQIILLIVINVVMLIWLRIIRPSGDRTELILAMLGVLSSTGVYICGLILLANPNGSPEFRDRIGIAMIVLGLWSVVAFIAGFIAFVIESWSLWTRFYHWLRPSRDHAQKFANVVYEVMRKDEHILARKYADRWLFKTLGGGLHGREVFRREIKDPRKKFYDAVLLANLQSRGKQLPNARRGPRKSGLSVASDDDQTLPVVSKANGASARWPGLQQLGLKGTDSAATGSDDTSPLRRGSSNGSPGSQDIIMSHNPVFTTDESAASEDGAVPRRRRKQHPAVGSQNATRPLGTRENLADAGPTEDGGDARRLAENSITRGAAPRQAVAVRFDEEQARTSPTRNRSPRRAQPTWARRTATSEKENV